MRLLSVALQDSFKSHRKGRNRPQSPRHGCVLGMDFSPVPVSGEWRLP